MSDEQWKKEILQLHDRLLDRSREAEYKYSLTGNDFHRGTYEALRSAMKELRRLNEKGTIR